MFKLSYLCIIPTINFFIDNYINLRQIFVLKTRSPKTASLILSEDKFHEAAFYNITKIIYVMLTSIFELLQTFATIKYSANVYEAFFAAKPFPSALFSTSFVLFSKIINVPFELFFDFVIERKFGYNKKTIGVFFKDLALNLVLLSVFGCPLFIICFHIIQKYSNFYIIAWLVLALFQIFIVLIYPTFIAPLYNKFTQLENEDLKSKIQYLAENVGFKITKIKVMDGSKRTGHSNAYFTGFGKSKQIVFYDTILQQLNDNQILAVLCHELGHWAHHHVFYLLALGLINLFVCFYLFNYFINFTVKEPICITFMKFSIIYSSLQFPLQLLINLISRVFERQADRFAVKHGYGVDLKAALVILHSENKGQPVVDSIYSAVHNSHPHTLERIETIDYEMDKLK